MAVSNTEIMWEKPLLTEISTQNTELIALTKALKQRNHKMTATACVYGPIYRKRGLLMTKETTIKNKEEILYVLYGDLKSWASSTAQDTKEGRNKFQRASVP